MALLAHASISNRLRLRALAAFLYLVSFVSLLSLVGFASSYSSENSTPLSGKRAPLFPNGDAATITIDSEELSANSRSTHSQRQEREQLYEAYNLLHTLAQVNKLAPLFLR